MPRNQSYPIRTDNRPTALGRNIGKQGNHQKRLFGTVQEMHEPIPIIMPVVQGSKIQMIIGFIFRSAEIRDEAVFPLFAEIHHAVFASDQLAHGRVGPGRKVLHGDGGVARHVDLFGRPGRFVRWRGAETGPDGGGECLGRFAAEALWDLEEAMFEPELFLLVGEGVVVGC